MKIAFTLCSNNYLAQAKTLGESLIEHNPDYRFIIALVDELNSEIDYTFFDPFEIIPVSEIGLDNFESLCNKFDLIELNTCVKASFFRYLFNRDSLLEYVFYFDPDIQIFNSLIGLENEFQCNNILLTPHILTPILPDGKNPGENVFLKYGIYNLGFIGVHNNSNKPGEFLEWWEKRILELGFNDTNKGLFVDQLWINLAPIFFNQVKILRWLGLNVAPWNLHERRIQKFSENHFLMQDGSALFFFHFSSYDFEKSETVSKHYNRYTFQTHIELKDIYDHYRELLIRNHIEEFSKKICIYTVRRNAFLSKSNLKISVSKKRIPKKSLYRNFLRQYIGI